MLDSICHTKSWKDYTGQHRQRGWGAASWNFWEERGWEMEAGVCLPEDDLAIGNWKLMLAAFKAAKLQKQAYKILIINLRQRLNL